jgi:signal transduction histidine kinase
MIVSPIRDAAGIVIGKSLIARDISEHRRLYDQIQEQMRELEEQNRIVLLASRMKNEFLANMSHELRSPLNAIIGFGELLYDGKLGVNAELHKEVLGHILGSSQHLLRLINDILDLAKVESGTLEFCPEPVRLEELIRDVIDMLGALAMQKGIRISTEIAPEVNGVAADPSKLKQILYNYLSNALKFTPDSGRVTVRIKPEGCDQFCLEVEDTGIGIMPEDVSRLFMHFQQLDGGTSKRYQGTGLGLALTKRITEAQGGRVGVRSVPGVGSVFFTVLPRICPGLVLTQSADAADYQRSAEMRPA